jgi:hypothetical protein
LRTAITWRWARIAAAVWLGAASPATAETIVGRWNTVDDKSGKVRSEVQVYEQGGKVFGKIVSLADPTDTDGEPRVCEK